MYEWGKVKKVLGNKTGITSYPWTVCYKAVLPLHWATFTWMGKLKSHNKIFQHIWFYNSNLCHFLWFIQKSCRKIVWKWVIVACFIIRKACFCSCAFNRTSLNVFWKPFVPNRCKMCQFRVIFCHFVNKYKENYFAHQTQWAR